MILSITEPGLRVLRDRRNARTERSRKRCRRGFTPRGARTTDGGRAAARATGPEHLMLERAPDRRRLQVGGAVEHDDGRVHVGARRVDRDHRAAGDLPRHPPRPAGAGEHHLSAVDDHGLPPGPGGARGHRRPTRRHVRPGPHLQRGASWCSPGRRCCCRSIRSRGSGGAVADRVASAPGARRIDADREFGGDPDRRVSRPISAASRSASTRSQPSQASSSGWSPAACWPRSIGGRCSGSTSRSAYSERLGLSHAARHRRAAPRPHRLVGQHHVRGRAERDPDRRDARHQAVRGSRDGLDEPGVVRIDCRRCRAARRVRRDRAPGQRPDVRAWPVPHQRVRRRQRRRPDRGGRPRRPPVHPDHLAAGHLAAAARLQLHPRRRCGRGSTCSR